MNLFFWYQRNDTMVKALKLHKVNPNMKEKEYKLSEGMEFPLPQLV